MATRLDIAAQPLGAADRLHCDLNIWLADLTYTQQAISADLIPQAVGGIATFTEERVAMARPIRIFKYPEKLVAALAETEPPRRHWLQ